MSTTNPEFTNYLYLFCLFSLVQIKIDKKCRCYYLLIHQKSQLLVFQKNIANCANEMVDSEFRIGCYDKGLCPIIFCNKAYLFIREVGVGKRAARLIDTSE